MTVRTKCSTSSRSIPVTMSSIGTMSGGSRTILRSPSTTSVSLASARVLSLDRALATLRSNALRCFAFPRSAVTAAMSSRSIRAYQTSRFDMPAYSCIAARYARATARLILWRSWSSKPRSRPATAKLATSRFTSHSNGPGSVSSKSLMLKIEPSIRRGERAEVREVGVAAELDLQAGAGRVREVGGHEVGGAAVERERGHEHPPVADRDQLGHARRVLLPEQLDRIAPAGAGHQVAVSGSRRRVARGLALRRAFGGAQVVDRLGRAAPGPWPRFRGSLLDVRHGDITPPARRERIIPFVRCRPSGGA